MKKERFLLSLVGCLVIGSAFFGIVFVYGQTDAAAGVEKEPLARKESGAKSLVADSKEVFAAPSAAFSFRPAAAENAALRDDLGWNFGKKAQRGWYLYVPLIQNTIGTAAGPETAEFARAVSFWQQKQGLSPSGRIDEDTLYGFVKYWQGRRLNSSRYPADDELDAAPAGSFYDPERDAALLRIERETYAAYKQMLRAAIADRSLGLKTDARGELAPEEKLFRVVSAFRSREYQAELRRKSPNSGSAGLAVNSPHFTGRALDIYVGGEPVETKDANRAVQVQTPVYKWLVKNAERFGFYPYYYEPWHWEYIPPGMRK